MKARFLCSAAQFSQLPAPKGEEFCVMGRSNVGKSSFINHVFADRTLARVSKKPGKTVLANMYGISDQTVWIDLPGYGFATASKGEKTRWHHLIDDICKKRMTIRGCIWLLDSRHAGLAIDMQALFWFGSLKMPAFPVLTKTDKLTKNEEAVQLRLHSEAFGFKEAPLLYSIQNAACRDVFWDRFSHWEKGLPVRRQ
jgi:GTP-binding protein